MIGSSRPTRHPGLASQRTLRPALLGLPEMPRVMGFQRYLVLFTLGLTAALTAIEPLQSAIRDAKSYKVAEDF